MFIFSHGVPCVVAANLFCPYGATFPAAPRAEFASCGGLRITLIATTSPTVSLLFKFYIILEAMYFSRGRIRAEISRTGFADSIEVFLIGGRY